MGQTPSIPIVAKSAATLDQQVAGSGLHDEDDMLLTGEVVLTSVDIRFILDGNCVYRVGLSDVLRATVDGRDLTVTAFNGKSVTFSDVEALEKVNAELQAALALVERKPPTVTQPTPENELRRWILTLPVKNPQEIADLFEREEITLDVLPDLTESDLRTVGLSVGAIKILWRALHTAPDSPMLLRRDSRSSLASEDRATPQPRVRKQSSESYASEGDDDRSQASSGLGS
eukprot:TRINITY_DN19172_c0_g1_i1.p1 TRINITY_DN19172_c0_g1~~TRINITY_DN19172_c0_g1_i1.p1  ORF type:complete len:245 (-),score=44.41 TRINITY_DN19172_c0_g1_i1:17-706(-)